MSGFALHGISEPPDDLRGGPFGNSQSRPFGGFLAEQPGDREANSSFGESTWTLIHTCAAVVTIGLVAIHLWIHRQWVTNVTRRVFSSLWQRPTRAAWT